MSEEQKNEFEEFEIFNVKDEIKNYFRANFVSNDDSSIERLITELRSMGCSQMQTVMLLHKLGEFSFMEANRKVLNSKEWNSKK